MECGFGAHQETDTGHLQGPLGRDGLIEKRNEIPTHCGEALYAVHLKCVCGKGKTKACARKMNETRKERQNKTTKNARTNSTPSWNRGRPWNGSHKTVENDR